MPTANKIELFARNNNLRPGWLSLGNQLGENYLNSRQVAKCDKCKTQIELGVKRYKSKTKANLDICEPCFKGSSLKSQQFFLLDNNVDEEILHEYLRCNICQAEPILGPRFKCNTCEDMDICEKCFDNRLQIMNNTTKGKDKKKAECENHEF